MVTRAAFARLVHYSREFSEANIYNFFHNQLASSARNRKKNGFGQIGELAGIGKIGRVLAFAKLASELPHVKTKHLVYNFRAPQNILKFL